MQLGSLKQQKQSPSSWDQSLTTTSCWVRVLGSFTSHIQSLGCIQHILQSTLTYYSFFFSLRVCVWGLSAVNPLPMCSHHGSTCPIFLRALADKVTGLIDASPRSPPLCAGSTPISISGVLERRVPVGTKDTTAVPSRPPCHIQQRLCRPVPAASWLQL